MRFIDRFLAFIKDNHLFNDGQSILLAVSGGKDSVLMTDLFAEAQFSFAIAHCNFQLRGEASDQDEIFVKGLAKQLDVPFYTVRFDTEGNAARRQISIQMAARDLRYEWLESIRQKEHYDYIAIAHHQTDSVETVLLNMLRGTGLAGLVGIAAKRDSIIRPLLAYHAQEVEDEVFSRGLKFREDASNASTKYKRNKIRLDVLPHLRELTEDLELKFASNSKRFLQANQVLKTIVEDFRALHFKEDRGAAFRIDLTTLKKLDPLEWWVYELFHPYGFSESVLNDLISTWDHGTGKRFLSENYELLIDRSCLFLSPVLLNIQEPVIVDKLPFRFSWYGKDYLIKTMEGDVDFKQFPVIVDAEPVEMPLVIRSWQEGDKFRPLGMQGKKKVSDLLIEQKVPLTKKLEVPLLVDARDDIIAVWPWRIDDRFKMTAKTKKVIIFEEQKNG